MHFDYIMALPEETFKITLTFDLNIKAISRVYMNENDGCDMISANTKSEAMDEYLERGYDNNVVEGDFIYAGILLEPLWENFPIWAEELLERDEGIRLLECGSFFIPHADNIYHALHDLTEFIKSKLSAKPEK